MPQFPVFPTLNPPAVSTLEICTSITHTPLVAPDFYIIAHPMLNFNAIIQSVARLICTTDFLTDENKDIELNRLEEIY
jgi:hypothetical protein